MADRIVTRTVRNRDLGDTVVQQETVANDVVVPAQEYTLFKMAQVLWYVAHLIGIILTLRFIFLLLGANLTGIVLFVYNLSEIFVAPFRGIFPSPRTGEMFFDTSALVAIAMYYLLVFIILKGLELLSPDPTQELA
jgi:hypothetical protein